MKKLLILLLICSSLFQSFSQEKGINYQAVILNPNSQTAGENLLVNASLSVQFTITNLNNTLEYQEKHTTSTDSFGMINLLIGTGTTLNDKVFSDIIWGGTLKKLKVEIDLLKGNGFNLLSEQNFTYIPKPSSKIVRQLILINNSNIVKEQTRAKLAEESNTNEILILKEEQTNQNIAIALNSEKISYPGNQDISGIAINSAALSSFKFYYADNDGDGFGDFWNVVYLPNIKSGYVTNNSDCNDIVGMGATIYPGAVEIADDGIDQDCDGFDLKTWYADTDNDTFGDAANTSTANAQPDNFVSNNTDCNDSDNTIYPGATEIADDGIDQDCDGFDLKTWYADTDNDTFGDAANTSTANAQPDNFVSNNTDCNDTDNTIYPGATEIADDGIDQNCDGFDLKTWYADTDNDTFGDAANTTTASIQPDNFVSNTTDCNDADDTIYPGATEIADDGIDQDCDGFDLKTWYADTDNDTFGDAANTSTANAQPDNFVSNNTDCNDTDNTIYPGATEIADDGIDQDCDDFDLKTWYVDADNDTFGDATNSMTANTQPDNYVSNNTDCNDTDNTIYPGATEIADDGVDQNCDGFDLKTWYADTDNDTFGDAANTTTASIQPDNFVSNTTDCNDADDTIYPGATEIADDGIDQDCDGFDLKNWYADTDNDTFGDAANTSTANAQPDNFVSNNTDCNDTDNTIYPGATEIADDGIDQNCDGFDLKTWYADTDNDTFGDAANTTTASIQPDNFVSNTTDCNDADDTIYPGATEIADDGIDQDCDGFDLKTWYADTDNDTFGDAANTSTANAQPDNFVSNNTDCNDTDNTIYPGATEIADDGIDQDCDDFDLKTWYVDADNDTFGDATNSMTANTQPDNYVSNNTDCNDTDNTIYPGATEIADDGVDQDCDGYDLKTWYADTDNDTFGDATNSITSNTQPDNYVSNNTDCNDSDNTIYLGATEIADDGIDQNCDGFDLKTWYADTDNDTFGDVASSTTANSQPDNFVSNNTDCNDSDNSIYPGAIEIADDGIDQDCDGFDLKNWYADTDNDTFGDVASSTTANAQPDNFVSNNTDCNDADNTIYPGATEIADDGIDQDCDGFDLKTWYADTDNDTFGDAANTSTANAQPDNFVSNNTDCNDTDNTIYPGTTEIADDGIDQDCDGFDLKTWYADTDNDTFGDLSNTTTASIQPANFVSSNTDCNDTDNSIYPGATEIADDGIDQDCDGFDIKTWYADFDSDTFGNYNFKTTANSQPNGFVSNILDCDDISVNAKSNYPGATEIADDGIDQDCDGFDLKTWYADTDNDTFGDVANSTTANAQPDNFVSNNTDCNDSDNSIYPGATEIADDGIDQNCDGFDLKTWYADTDSDTYGDAASSTTSNTQPANFVSNNTDCNDSEETIYPGATEISDDGIDQDCDDFDHKTWYADADGDTYGDPLNTKTASSKPENYVADNTDCDDTPGTGATIYPGATEIDGDGIDQDCNLGTDFSRTWYIDKDEDTYGDPNTSMIALIKPDGYVDNNLDCNDSDNLIVVPDLTGPSPFKTVFEGSLIYPGAYEIGNDGIDQNCNGSDAINWYPDNDGDGYGNEDDSLKIIADIQPDGYVRGDGLGQGDCNDNDPAVYFFSGNDIPDDGIDQDCDGYDLKTWYADADGDGFGDPNVKVIHNFAVANHVQNNTDCDDTSVIGKNVYPGAKEFLNDGIDQDCDGYDLTTWYADIDGDGYGDNETKINSNTQPNGYVANNVDCDDTLLTGASFNPEILEIANDGIDQNCDGTDLRTWYEDKDSDSFGNLNITLLSERKPEGYVLDHTDCNDEDDTIYPGATEIRDDGIDQDCDNFDLQTWFQDIDNDSFGNPDVSIEANSKPEGYVLDHTDCNDEDDTIYPGATEIIDDDIDQDCDDFDLKTWYADTDGDGYGDKDVFVIGNIKPEGYVLDNTDCNDDDKDKHPNAYDRPNDGIDQDCDGNDLKRWYIDKDGDGYGYISYSNISETLKYSNEKPEGYVENDDDCNDTLLNGASFNPDIIEIPNDGIDQNCDGLDLRDWYIDADGDGYGDPNIPPVLKSIESYDSSGYSTNKSDCDDTPITGATIYPGAPEITNDGIDQDCDGYDLKHWFIDEDNDGYGYPQYVDRQIFYVISGGIISNTQPAKNFRNNYSSFATNSLDCSPNDDRVYPGAPEILDDDWDQDCSGYDLKTWYEDKDNDNYGDPNSTPIISDIKPDGYINNNKDCDDDPTTGVNVYPGATEIPGDSIDQDCDGIGIIYTWYRDADNDNYGDVNVTLQAETKPDGYVLNNEDCDDDPITGVTVYPGATEIIDDGIDQDCDGFDLITWFEDLDKDQFGNADITVLSNTNIQPDGFVIDNTDCNDSQEIGATIYPGALEIANDGIDQDCNNLDLIIWYKDADLDGFGNPDKSKSITSQTRPDYTYVKNNTDCDDTVKN